MEIKTTYDRAITAFMFYPYGFKGKIIFKDILAVRKAFSKIREILMNFEGAIKIKVDEHNMFLKENPKLTIEEKQEIGKKIEAEYREAKNNVVIEVTEDEKNAIIKTLNEIIWPDDKKPSAVEIDELSKFIEDISK